MQTEKQNETVFNSIGTEIGTTFPDVKKGSPEPKINYITDERSIVVLKLDELETHPHNQSIYLKADPNKVKSLARNIEECSLINRIIVNKNCQILSGNIRFQALLLLEIKEIEVYVIDIKPEEELEFIISANQQREKTVIDARNEIMSLYEKYSPGQGNRDTQGENTIKKIALITGYSTNKISSIRRIDYSFPLLLEEVSNGNMTLNAASKKCDIVTKLEVLGKELEQDFLTDLSVDKIDKTFEKSVLAYCENKNPEYSEMIKAGKMTAEKAYNDLLSSKDPKEPSEPKTSQIELFGADDSTICPCCVQKVKKDNKELDFVKRWSQNIQEYVANLRYSDNAA